MAEQSHRDEMNAAIRAQRERQAVPRTIAPVEDTAETVVPEPEVEQPPPQEGPQRKSLLNRLRRR